MILAPEQEFNSVKARTNIFFAPFLIQSSELLRRNGDFRAVNDPRGGVARDVIDIA